VPCGPINDLAQVFDDPQVRHRGLRIELPHPLAGNIPLVASPIRYAGSGLAYTRAGPTLGQDTEAILRDVLAIDAAEIARLRACGIV
jgi:crotonobetainyl-CoA:carnitine CoA-transferase CaiB-like acyl-CoA transferase